MGRDLFGHTSATSAAPAANSPPMPIPVMNRATAYCCHVCTKPLSSVHHAYIRRVLSIVRARPSRSPSIPKMNPPVAHPTRKNAVISGPMLDAAFCSSAGSEYVGLKQFQYRRLADQVEQVLVHAVEHPAEGRNDEDEPRVLRYPLVPSQPAFGLSSAVCAVQDGVSLPSARTASPRSAVPARASCRTA